MNMDIKKKRWLANVSHYSIVVLTNIRKIMNLHNQYILQNRYRLPDYEILFQRKDQNYTADHYCIWQRTLISSFAN